MKSILSLILLPLFFALTGLRTRLDLLNDPAIWLWTGFILILAVIGKDRWRDYRGAHDWAGLAFLAGSWAHFSTPVVLSN